MLLSSLLVTGIALWQHVSLVNANVLQVNAQCKKNACLSAVQSNRNHPNHKEVLPGCTSFFRKTVTPRPATKTIKKGAKPTVTKKVTKTVKHKASITAIVTSTSTVHVKSTTTITVSAGAGKRDAEAVVSKKKTCPTGPARPSRLPSYASACRNTVAFSSACSCVGVKHGVTTLPRCTNTVTKRPAGTVTFTKTIQVGATATITVATHTNRATKTVTDAITVTVTKPSTSPSGCAKLNAFDVQLNSLDGSITNGTISETPLAGGLGILTPLLGGGGSPTSFNLDAQGHLLTAAGEQVGVLAGAGTTLNTIPLNSSLLGQLTQPTCQLGPEPNCDQLSCDLGGGENQFAYCSGDLAGAGQGLALVGSLPALGNCKYVNVTAAASA